MKLYRYEAHRYSVCLDPERELYGSSDAKLECRSYPVSHVTKKGYWTGYNGGKDRWVSATARKRFAHPTKEEALEGYRQRKKSFVRHASATLRRAEEDLALVSPTTPTNTFKRIHK